MIRILAVGKIKEAAMRTLIEEYQKRLRPFARVEIVEVVDEHAPQSNSETQNMQVKEKEGERLLARIKDSDHVILLDLHGEMISSEQLADKLEKLEIYQTGNLVFVIAGSLGPGQNIYQRANWRWKLSALTFTHQMTRILVLEQLYRSYMIRHHNPYHK